MLGLVTVPGIVTVGTLGLFISKMVFHLGFHHFFDGSTQKIFQGFLDVSCRLNVQYRSYRAAEKQLSHR